MKHLLQIFLLCLLPALLGAQVTPSEYDAALEAARDKWRIAKFEGWDIVLDPEEQVALLPTALNAAVGNWGAEHLGSNARYEAIKSAAKRKVAVFIIDTGDGWPHPYLSAFAWNEKGKDFTGQSADKNDVNGHSTHCAGIIGGIQPGTPIGAARMLVEAGYLKGIPYQALTDAGSGSFSWVDAALLSARDEAKALQAQGWACVISMSLGGSLTVLPPATEAALKACEDQGILIVVAAGNTGGTPVQYPGKSKYATAVGALQQTGAGGVERAPYSSHGPELFCAMPGSSIYSTYKQGTALLSGTSMATPHEAAVGAILLCLNPSATAAQVKAHLQKYAQDLPPAGKDNFTGYGVNILAPLLDNPMGGTPPPPPPPDTTPVKERTVNITVEDLVNNWRNYSSGTMQKLYFSYTLAVKTSLPDAACYDYVVKSCKDLYSRSALVLADGDGFAAATYYTGRFAEILLKQQYKLDVTCLQINGADDAWRLTTWRKGDEKPILGANRFMRAATDVDLRRTYIKRRRW